jgi:hypothetical protein
MAASVEGTNGCEEAERYTTIDEERECKKQKKRARSVFEWKWE